MSCNKQKKITQGDPFKKKGGGEAIGEGGRLEEVGAVCVCVWEGGGWASDFDAVINYLPNTLNCSQATHKKPECSLGQRLQQLDGA